MCQHSCWACERASLCSFIYSHYSNFNYTNIRKLHNRDTMNSINLNDLLFKEVRQLKRNHHFLATETPLISYSLKIFFFCFLFVSFVCLLMGGYPLGFGHERILSHLFICCLFLHANTRAIFGKHKRRRFLRLKCLFRESVSEWNLMRMTTFNIGRLSNYPCL